MELKYHNIILRDMEERDIGDEIRWNTVQTQWALWDAPWEMEEELKTFDPEAHRKKELEWIAKPKPDHRRCLEIDTWDGVHLGAVNCYCIDDGCNWLEKAPDTEEGRKAARWAVGLDICEPAYWNGGWGAQALAAFIRYHLDGGYTELYTQTWSGNVRMTALAEKLGFRECRRKEGIRQVRGETYDGLTFRLDRDAFEEYCARPGRRCACARWRTRGKRRPSRRRCCPACPSGSACRTARRSTSGSAGGCPSGRRWRTARRRASLR